MDFANIQAQLANLTSQLSHIAEGTTMQSVPTCGVSYGQGYPTHQCSQFATNEDTWDYQGYDQPSDNLCSNTYNSDWSNHSNPMWWEPQQVQQDRYWQPYEEFYSRPMQPPQLPQSVQTNSGTSLDNDTVIKLLTSLSQGQENQDKKVDELEKHIGQIMEFMVQIQEQSELSNSTIENLKENFEIHDAITLESGMEGGTSPKTSKPSQNMDEQLLFEEEEDDKATAREEPPLPQPTLAPLPLPQPPNAPPLSNTGKLGQIFVNSNPIPPNVPFPRRFMISKQEESEKYIVVDFPKVQVVGEYVECIKEAVFETTKPKEVEFYDTGQVPTITFNLAKSNITETFKGVVFVLEFLSEQASKPSSPTSILFSTNLLILMIQAPTLEFRPLPDHFKYHLPFKDKFHGSIVRLQDVKESATWEATHAFQQRKT